ncbi:hypothetical protein GGX14DRAFT_397493 [Mycena pura]|uniref:Uncharacterized protein n=1 Tax=Mycena pura TaxID=153505 RepID=A0AAD6VCJ0_9AGAR|nr:hypothetical protein GGX14DRAFT_397493 [Mycena pura]
MFGNQRCIAGDRSVLATHAACDAHKCALIDKARAYHGAVFPGHAPPAQQCTPHAARATAPSSTKVHECPGAVFPGARAAMHPTHKCMLIVDYGTARATVESSRVCRAVRAANASAAGNFLQVKVLEDD